MATNEIKANNALRLIALSTTDSAVALLALDVLEESESEAKSELSKTCYADQIDNLRAAVLVQNESSRSRVSAKDKTESTFSADWTPPQWCHGLSKRTADGLVRRAQYDNLEQVIFDRLNKPDSHFTSISNFGNKCLDELDAWLRHNGLI